MLTPSEKYKFYKSQFLLDKRVTFLNHGSFGACPVPVFRTYQKFQRILEKQPIAFLDRNYDPMMNHARHILEDYLNAGRDTLFFTPNVTTSLNIVAASLELGAGDEILTSDLEYGACDRMWEFYSAQRGFTYRKIKTTLPLSRFAEDFIREIKSNTKVIFLSHITSGTAVMLPVKEIIAEARKRGILTVIDGAHAPGQIDLSLSELGADFYGGNCHKWLMAPKGAAFLYQNPACTVKLSPLIISWGNTNKDSAGSYNIDEFQYQGTRDISPCLSVPDAVKYNKRMKKDGVRDYCREMIIYSAELLEEENGLEPFDQSHTEAQLQMLAFRLPGIDGAALKKDLYDKFRIEIPVNRYNGDFLLRISFQCYNRKEDIRRLSKALKSLWVTGTKQFNAGS
ncbi:MAG: aminotransferase class V-fold PLP-dependent enzyme [Ignavibacteriaceae bacterium]|nr:aminotransferase class V-fold PLP-dependent enzyme [Ignavibacteriaceae bacterium]